jgi:hypothetical protein
VAQNVKVRIRAPAVTAGDTKDRTIIVQPGQTVTVKWEGLFTTFPGTVTVIVDPDNRIVESNELNNQKSANY